MVLALAAMAAAAASFPTGFGFGAGYGAGVRVGYDIIYPKIAPALRNIAEDIVGAVNSLFGEGGAPTSSVPSGFDFAAGPTELTARAESRFGAKVDLEEVVNPLTGGAGAATGRARQEPISNLTRTQSGTIAFVFKGRVVQGSPEFHAQFIDDLMATIGQPNVSKSAVLNDVMVYRREFQKVAGYWV